MIEKRFAAPALPLPPQQYDALSATDQIRVLRLYFNLLDNFFSNTILDALNGGAGGNGITFPHIAASDSTDQRTTNNTATVVKWNTLDSGYLTRIGNCGRGWGVYDQIQPSVCKYG